MGIAETVELNKESALLRPWPIPFSQQYLLKSERTQSSSTPDQQPTYVLPACFHDQNNEVVPIDVDLRRFLGHDLSLERLDAVYPFLQLAGRYMAARSLHRQLMMGRKIVITEQADLHLTWNEAGMLIKPFPAYLMDRDIWSTHLCADIELYKSACGFVRSYTWLVSRENDFNIATKLDNGITLLPRGVEWDEWIRFVRDFIRATDAFDEDFFHRRYKHGELRLSRLDLIYRCYPRVWPESLLRGYHFGFHTYESFFHRNFAWLIVVFAYVSVMLTAMQLGLTTRRLQDSPAFQAASYGFTGLSILVPVISVSFMLILFLALVFNDVVATVINHVSYWRHGKAGKSRKESGA